MARADSLARLALAYGVHLARRQLTRRRPQLDPLMRTYAPDGIRSLEASERERLPRLVTCINCGLCALAAGRVGKTRLPDLASSYMRLYSRLDECFEILEMQVASVTLLESWTDHLHDRTYTNVARLVMRYRVRRQWKEWTFDRQVHLVAAADGWRAL